MLDSPVVAEYGKGRKANERPELRAFRIEAPTPFGYRVAGRLVMGISRARYLQLVDQYSPDSLTRAPERRLDEAIRALIGQPEMAKLISYLGLPEDADVRLDNRPGTGPCGSTMSSAKRPLQIQRTAPSSGLIRSES
jgi:hypothetical protein